ncbi:MAG: hypothetical protein J6U54_05440 [Clostridiales bacterium]|nr:hypothetical protein [Clostridiales bacterium]
MITLKVSDQNPIHLKVVSQNPHLHVGEAIYIIEEPAEVYDGPYEVSPMFEDQTLHTENKLMEDNVIVDAIEVSRTTNPSGGTTVYIGGIING